MLAETKTTRTLVIQY